MVAMNPATTIGRLHCVRDASSTKFNVESAFAPVCAGFILSSALLAALCPIWLSIGSLFLFAGPHNFLELRYFLSRCPSRLSKMRAYFCVSLIGGPLLAVAYSLFALRIIMNVSLAPAQFQVFWNITFLGWLAILSCLSRWSVHEKLAFCSAAIAVICLSLLIPPLLPIAMVYAHPLVGLWILEKEIKLCRPKLLTVYRKQLLLVLPVVLLLIGACWRSGHLEPDNPLTARIIQETGSQAIDFLSSRLMLTVHIFLEMLHYGVWLLAIPAVTFASRRWEIGKIPLVHRGNNFKRLVLLLFGAAALATVALWALFMVDYKTTREIYFAVAMMHVIMEFPFLMKSFNGAK